MQRAIGICLTRATGSAQLNAAAGPQYPRTSLTRSQSLLGRIYTIGRSYQRAASTITALGSHASKGVGYVTQETRVDRL